MPVFITSKSVAQRHGVYAIEQQLPSVITATGTGQCAIIGQFPWGPDQVLTQPTTLKQMVDMLAPAGMDRTGSGYLSLIRKAWPLVPKFVRVTGTSPAKATASINKTGPTLMLTLQAKYNGAAGNNLTATVAAATDGDPNHFNLTVSVTGPSGTTTDFLQNLNYSGTGADSAPDLSNALLLGSITKNSSGTPIVGTVNFSTGSDGTISSSSYVGTAGTADKGIALLETDRTIDHFFSDDPGNSIRAAVNAGLMAHADQQTDRIAYINGPIGQTSAQAITDVANYRSNRVCYVDSWVYILDDVNGTKRLVPSACFAASVAAQLVPSTSIAWKGTPVRTMLSGIAALESDRGDAAATQTKNGITTLMNEVTGGFTFEAAVNTNNAVNPAIGTLNRTRMGHFIARSITTSLRPSVDLPNVPEIQLDEMTAVDSFLNNLVLNRSKDPINLPHIVSYHLFPISSANSQADLDAGQFSISAQIKTSSAQSFIFVNLTYGETVNPTVTL